MRLPEIARGDGVANRVLICIIPVVSGMRLPDAAVAQRGEDRHPGQLMGGRGWRR